MAIARDIKLKNCQVYDENGDPIYGTLEGKMVLKVEYGDTNRLQKGKIQTVNDWHVEVTLKITATNAALKYYCVEQLTQGKTPVLPFLIGETLDKEAGNSERVRISNIVLNPEEITLWEAKADGNDHATYDLKGMSIDKPDYLDELPAYIE
ncbi:MULTISPECIES: hypothetical protein [Brevibacillus]|uniref:Uncharacterized protein n=1 Tax=Brevibacillus parabrevis TaxID=54914 RepID=A0A4Y3PJG8_BREPA|nr:MULTISPECIES: hypothetical protein [Brevibacillus]TGV29603.1 hypothetical protein EN829_039730 [Mesorhizobium sp. M00.F.Ca.ET.186.01.1.1]KZE37959.1 hypothetical protein AV540_26100 [Brevibacillus parabrevis]MBU8715822.1 hypothetical protein [Brevibacillus parabrevis]MDH6352578.1 hypothetical protein [Brevibacillus sp. 1238]MDR4998121.1 hypothetical protein [Brevibacillus parabrevis]